MTNLIIKSSFVVGFFSLTLFLVFQVSINSWKGNFVLKSQIIRKIGFQREKIQMTIFTFFTPNFTVSCM